MRKCILITSVGSLVGQNILDSLQDRRINIDLIGTNSIVAAANNYRCDKCYLVSEAVDEALYIKELMKIIESEKPDVIIPGRDDDIVILSKMKELMSEYHDSFLVGSEKFARIMDDKVQSYHFSNKNGLPFSPTIESGLPHSKKLAEELIEKFSFPLIAKPSKGNGSRGMWFIVNQKQVDKIIKEPGFAIQPFFGQSEKIDFDTSFGLPFIWEIPEKSLYAAQVLIGRNGEIGPSIGFVSTMVGGKCERMDKCDDPLLLEIANSFATYAMEEGWRGPFNIQLKKDIDHGYQVIEMNGRFSGGTSARYYLGFDEVSWLINNWVEEKVVPETSVPQGINLVTKILSDFGIKQSNMDILNQNRVWEKTFKN